MLRGSGCILIIAIAGHAAWAETDEHKATLDLVAAQIQALERHDAGGFARTITDEGFAFLPNAADEGRGTDAITAAATRWLTGLGQATIKLANAHYGTCWYDGELVVNRFLMVVMQPWAVAADHGQRSTLVAAHFSVAQR